MKPILEVRHLSKKYRIRHAAGGYLNLRERVLRTLKFGKMDVEDFWAISDLSFDVMPGESVGIIGRNGAGKSTLLKILSKITPPSRGQMISRGRLASLLEVGTGFHPELTGRENIFFNGSLLGMKRREIEEKFDEIVNFSGVEKFLDTPLKHYSSGMQLRLAFSVAAFLEPEILIIDEVLAVGDAEFQKKCLGKMEEVSRSGRTILFVSHNMTAVESLCSRAIMMDNGRKIAEGSSQNVISIYQNQMSIDVSETWKRNVESKSPLAFKSLKVSVTGDQPNLKLIVYAELISNGPHPKAFIAFDIKNAIGTTFMQALPKLDPFISHSEVVHQFEVVVNVPPLVPDKYYITVWVGAHNLDTLDLVRDAVSFDVLQSPTPGRTFPHTFDHGMIVPASTITILS